MIWTAIDLAKKLGVTPATVKNHCKRLGIRKTAGAYIMTADQADKVRQSVLTAKPGRPRKA